MFGKKDTVCKIRVKNTEYQITYKGRVYYFDCKACMRTFEENPERFARKGKIRGFLEAKVISDIQLKSCHDLNK